MRCDYSLTEVLGFMWLAGGALLFRSMSSAIRALINFRTRAVAWPYRLETDRALTDVVILEFVLVVAHFAINRAVIRLPAKALSRRRKKVEPMFER
jgi:hypothetical protein